MRPRRNPKPTKKLTYFLVSVALHLFLGGLLVYLYINLQNPPGKPEKSPGSSVATAPEASSVTPQIARSSARKKLSPSSVLVPEKEVSKKAKETKPPVGNAQTEIPQPGTPAQENGTATSLRSYPGEKSSSPKNIVAKEPQINKRLRSNPSNPKQRPATPVTQPKNTAKNKPLAAAQSTASPTSLENNITQAQFTTGIKQLEPIDQVGPVVQAKSKGIKKLYYFTEVKGMKGETITHRWVHEGQVIAKVQLKIGSNLWRTYSSKRLTPAMTGNWRVVVTDSQGRPIHSDRFVYTEPREK